jgi:hypothetical protein
MISTGALHAEGSLGSIEQGDDDSNKIVGSQRQDDNA